MPARRLMSAEPSPLAPRNPTRIRPSLESKRPRIPPRTSLADSLRHPDSGSVPQSRDADRPSSPSHRGGRRGRGIRRVLGASRCQVARMAGRRSFDPCVFQYEGTFSREPGEGGSSDMRKSQLRVPSSEGSPALGTARMYRARDHPWGGRPRLKSAGCDGTKWRAEGAAPKELE